MLFVQMLLFVTVLVCKRFRLQNLGLKHTIVNFKAILHQDITE